VNAEQAFQLLNLVVLPWWAAWLVAPRSRWALRAASHGAVFVGLAAVYAVLLGAAIAGGGPGGGLGFDALRASLAAPIGFLAGWTHYLCFDLFVGAWIVRESRRIDVEPRAFLFFTLMAGPIGLGGFLVRRGWRLRSLGQIGETDLV
jgi:hypothetical protein